MDNAIGFPNTYPLDSDLSGGLHYPSFEQLDTDESLSSGYVLRKPVALSTG